MVLIVMSVYDLRHKIIPNSVSLIVALTGLLSVVLKYSGSFIIPSHNFYAGIVLPLIFALFIDKPTARSAYNPFRGRTSLFETLK